MAEFPKTLKAARDARNAGEAVVFGASNVVHGGSHTNAVKAADMIAEGLCDVPARDCYYPAPVGAAFRLERDGIVSLDDAWKLISENVAYAAGFDDCGAIREGLRADLVLIDEGSGQPLPVVTLVGGDWYGQPIVQRAL